MHPRRRLISAASWAPYLAWLFVGLVGQRIHVAEVGNLLEFLPTYLECGGPPIGQSRCIRFFP